MTGRYIVAAIAGVGGASTAAGTSLAALDPNVDWGSPQGLGAAFIAFGLAIGAGIGAYAGTLKMQPQAPETRVRRRKADDAPVVGE